MMLRKVEYYETSWVPGKDKKQGYQEKSYGEGLFHTWGQRGDEQGVDFFGVVETPGGQCLELDPIQIRFLEPEK